MRPLYFLISIVTLPVFSSAGSPIDSLLSELDMTLKLEQQYTTNKLSYIGKLRQELNVGSKGAEEMYFVYQNLAEEYKTLMSDSSLHYAVLASSMAQRTGNPSWMNDSKIELARVQSKGGLFMEALQVLKAINPKELNKQQLILYYGAFAEVYIYWLEYLNGYDQAELIEKRLTYQDSILQIVETNSFEHAVNYGTRFIEIKDFKNAERVLFAYFPKVKPDTKEYAYITSIMAYYYEQQGDREKQKEFLIRSAIADIRVVMKENISLRNLALLLFEEQDIMRANHYIKQSLDDANFYNARLRNIQTSRYLPIIDKAYQLDKEQQQRKLRILLIVVSFLTLILLASIILVFREMKKLAAAKREIEEFNTKLKELNSELKKANRKQNETNISLREANHVKELFVRNFLEISMEYMNKLDAFKITVNRKIKAGQVSELLGLTSYNDNATQDLKELYSNFDRAFLNIYPSFIEEFNQLLREEEHYPTDKDDSLKQELRVFALIKLGIDDTHKIATFLHYTPRTVYNYRSKVKARALNQDADFEEKVRMICTVRS
ncbi:MAG: DUF6377 domain-containing protein [Prolixibacteraceae bacterium]